MPFMPFTSRNRDDLARRREDAEGLRAPTFELETLQFVEVGEGVGLLRVGGHWVAEVDVALPELELRVDRDGECLWIAPLPDLNSAAPLAGPRGELWRGAFTVGVEIAEDPRTEFSLVAGDDATVALPRPEEWAAAQAKETAQAAEAAASGSGSPVVAELMAKLADVAQLEADDAAEPEPEPVVADPEPVAAGADTADLERLREDLSQAESLLVQARAERDEARVQLDEARAELEIEQARRAELDEQLRSRIALEDDLRKAVATQEAELASAAAKADQLARGAEHRRDATDTASGPPERSRANQLDEAFLARLERANRASETATG